MDGMRPTNPAAWAKRRRAHLEAKAAERERLRQMRIDLVRSGEADKLFARGIDIFAQPDRGSADGGAGRTQMGDMPPAPPTMSEWIRAVVNDPERKEERERIKRAGNNDARNVPDDAPPPVSWPPQPWEQT